MRKTAMLAGCALLLLGRGEKLDGADGPPAPSRAVPASGAFVSGVVYDSVGKKPLAGALVQLVTYGDTAKSRFYSARSDSIGEYRFADVRAGRYLLGFFHEALDRLGLSSPLRIIEVRAENPLRADIGIPSVASIRAALCPAGARDDSVAMLLGHVLDSDSQNARGGSTVAVRWSEIIVDSKGIRANQPEVTGRTNDGGWFAICDLPARTELLVRAANGADSSGYVEVTLPPGGLVARDFYVGGAEPATGTAGDSATPPPGTRPDSSAAIAGVVRRGSAKLSGTVRSAAGRPVGNARVVVWGSGVEGVTDIAGTYALSQLPGGTHTLEVRALGYAPVREAVDLLQRRTTSRDVVMPAVTPLDTVRVRGTVLYSRDVTGFERRRRSGLGRYFTRDDIERQRPLYASDLLRMLPSVQVVQGTFGQKVIMRGGGGFSSYCAPVVFLNGMRMSPGFGDLDLLARLEEINAMEVYTRGSSTPAEFSTMDGCGSIVVWTGPPPRRPESAKKR